MAHGDFEHPIRAMHGSLEPHGIIHRQKQFRDERGKVIHEGRQEAYKVKNPRDWKRTPAQGAELAHHNRWRETCNRTTQILQAAQPDGLTEQQIFHKQINHIPDYYTQEEARALYNDYHARFQAQLPNTRGKHPDPQAPIDPKTGTGKRYSQLPSFIRALVYLQLKSAE